MKRRYKSDLSKAYSYLGAAGLELLSEAAKRQIAECEVEGYVVYTPRKITAHDQAFLAGYASALLRLDVVDGPKEGR